MSKTAHPAAADIRRFVGRLREQATVDRPPKHSESLSEADGRAVQRMTCDVVLVENEPVRSEDGANVDNEKTVITESTTPP